MPQAGTSHAIQIDTSSQSGYRLEGAVLLGLAAIWVIQVYYPVYYVYLIAEDSLGEYATSIAFLVASVLFAAAALRSRGLMHLAYAGLALVSFGIGGEEVSWGQRIFGIDTPEMLAAVNRQNELTFHNIGPLQHAPFHEVAGLALLAGLLFSTDNARARMPLLRAVPRLPAAIWPVVTAAAAVCILSPFIKSEEIAELMLGLVALSWSVGAAIAPEDPNRTAFPFRRLAIALGAVALGAVIMSSQFSKDMGWRYNITAGRDYLEEGLYEQSLEIFDYVIANPEYLQPDTLANRDRVLALLDQRR